MRPTAKCLVLLILLPFLLIQCGDDSSPTGPGSIGPVGPGVNNDVTVVEAFSFDVAVTGQTRLKLEGVNGSIDISGSTSASTAVIAGERRVDSTSQEDARAGLELLRVNITDGADVILVRTVQPQGSDSRNYIVNYQITLPRNLAVILSNVNGSIAIDSINNRVAVVNTNGGVELSAIVGDASVSVVNGAIGGHVTLPANGTLEFQTLNGAIDLDIPRATSARFVATTVNGTIRITNLDLRTSISTLTRVEGTLGGGQGRITLGTTNGGIAARGF